MPRILSIDYGKKRTGLAVTDPLQIIATPLDCVHTESVFLFLKKYFKTEPVETVVIGYPLNSDGTPTDVTKDVISFKRKFEKNFPSVPVEMYDERYTSVIAKQTMLAGGLGKKARSNKGLVDKISATVLLQGFMEYKGRRVK